MDGIICNVQVVHGQVDVHITVDGMVDTARTDLEYTRFIFQIWARR